MKQYLLLLTIAGCLCLSGCKSKKDVTDAAPINEQQTVNDEGNEAEAEAIEETAEPLNFALEDEEKTVNLIDTDEFTFNLYVYRDLSDGYYDYSYELINKKSGHEVKKIEIHDLYINGDILIGDDLADYTYSNNERITAKRINSYIYTNDVECLTSIKGSAQAYYVDGSMADEPFEFDTQVDSTGTMAYDLEPFMDAMAVTQSLYTDDSIDVELIGLGGFNGSNGSLKGLLKVANLTNENKPFAISTCVINDVCFKCGYDVVIPPKSEHYYDFYVLDSDIMKSGITSISSIKMLLLINEEENTAINGERTMGGQLYEVDLCKKGNETAPEVSGDMIYDDNNVKVYITGGKADETTLGTDIYCYVTIVNNTDENISFGYSDTMANGVNCSKGGYHTWRLDLSYVNSSTIDNVIPSGCRKDETIMFWKVENLTFPCKCTCKLDFMSAGGGELLFRSDDVEFTFDGITE